MTPTIRPLLGEERNEIIRFLSNYAFAPSPPLPDPQEWRERVQQRAGASNYGVFEGDRPVASAGLSTLRQNVRGRVVSMGGVFGVATHPAARRRGYARQLMAHLFGEMRAAGHVTSCLYPFRESFYERMGYAGFPQFRAVRFSPTALAPIAKRDFGGTVELGLLSEGYDAYRDVLANVRHHVHGFACFEASQKASAKRSEAWLALVREGETQSGVLVYDLKGAQTGAFTLRAQRFYYTTLTARRLLLQWLARHADQANEVELWLPPYELPETWHADLKLQVSTPWIAPMGRVVDVSALAGLPCGAGAFTAAVADPLCPWNEGAWRFEGRDGRLQVTGGGTTACTLTINALSALVYGTHDPADFDWRGWGDPPPAAQAEMRVVFPPAMPYLHELF